MASYVVADSLVACRPEQAVADSHPERQQPAVEVAGTGSGQGLAPDRVQDLAIRPAGHRDNPADEQRQDCRSQAHNLVDRHSKEALPALPWPVPK
jgi:hypothetical protein